MSFNGEILNSFPGSFHWFILNNGLFYFFGDVFDLCFHCIVVGDCPLNWNPFVVNDFLVLDNFSFVGDSLYSLHLVVLDVLLLKWDVFDPALNWNLLGDCPVDV